MPELPEVEGYRRYVEGTALDQTITAVEAINEGRMLRNVGLKALREASVGERFVSTSRIGKFLFLHLSNEKIQMWHFGLTGEPVYYQSAEERPRFTRLIFHFDSGFQLAFNCLRKFGRLDLLDDIPTYQKQNKLGPDATQIREEDFIAALQNRKTMIKPALLQQKHFAGIGNWIADEMLFQIKLHPETRCHEVRPEQYKAMYKVMQEILETAINLDAHYKEFPDHFMVERRWQKGCCPIHNVPLQRIVVGGRGTFFCPICQPEPQKVEI
ncbi:MAG: DNA-formamidopyrimidine glycosylase family protein [Bacteroidota bacterium]